ncbi:MAG: DUF4835 family protein [bacterium]|nr:DUF4835 family protein [bacterium]
MEPRITINLDKVPDDVKPLWDPAVRTLTNYLSVPAWHDDPFDYVVPVSIGIFIDQVIEKPPERTYRSYIIASNGAETQFSDKRWIFNMPDWNMIQRTSSPSFQPLLSNLEFYTMLILAAEYDKWDLYGGDIWYSRARGVCDLGKFDTRYVSGWPERSEVLQHLMSNSNRLYRQFYYYAFTGEYLTANNPREAKTFVDSTFILLPKIKSDDREQFFSTQAVLLANAAERMRRTDYLQQLATLDTARRVLYEERLQKLMGK